MRLLARGLVHLRWVIIGLWAILGVIASIRAPRTPDLLNLRGGSTHPTEAFLADAYLSHRFPRPFSDFFAITVQGPSSFRSGQPRATLTYQGTVTTVTFSPSQPWLVVAAGSEAQFYPFEPKAIIAAGCDYLPANLTKEQWAIYLPDERYRKTCPNKD